MFLYSIFKNVHINGYNKGVIEERLRWEEEIFESMKRNYKEW